MSISLIPLICWIQYHTQTCERYSSRRNSASKTNSLSFDQDNTNTTSPSSSRAALVGPTRYHPCHSYYCTLAIKISALLPISWTLHVAGSLCLFGRVEAAYPALPICGSDKLYTDKCSLSLDELLVCLSTYLAACITMLIRFFAPCVQLTWPYAHWTSSVFKYRHDQCAL